VPSLNSSSSLLSTPFNSSSKPVTDSSTSAVADPDGLRLPVVEAFVIISKPSYPMDESLLFGLLVKFLLYFAATAAYP